MTDAAARAWVLGHFMRFSSPCQAVRGGGSVPACPAASSRLRELQGLGQQAECVARAAPTHVPVLCLVRTCAAPVTVASNLEIGLSRAGPPTPYSWPKMKRQTRVLAHFEAVAVPLLCR